nr:Biotin-(acetyl-CoA carboxylase) ligase [uncultured Gammaproteobacteria bacterium]
MNVLEQTLILQLADGQFHSGTALGQQTGRTRTAVWKAIRSLQQNGLSIYSVRGKGYRLAEAVELLNREEILTLLNEVEVRKNAPKYLQQLDVFYDIESTNAYLLDVAKKSPQTAHACLAEQQSSGRGRRGRHWISPFGGNLYFSLLWQFSAGASQLGGLSLAVAVAVMRVLAALGLRSAGVKWPNDILVNGKKLAGILLEVSGEAAGPCAVVIGVGLNVRGGGQAMSALDQPWTDLETGLGKPVSRNHLASQLICHLIDVLREFETGGLSPFLKEWAIYDVFADSKVVLNTPQGNIHGIARGVDETGALILVTTEGVQRYHSGEVSLRAVPARGTN